MRISSLHNPYGRIAWGPHTEGMRGLVVGALVALGVAVIGPARAQQSPQASWLDEVAESYRAWGRVDDELRWAPWLCRMPMASLARVSRAPEGEHRRKVYFVYASDRERYLGVTTGNARPRRGLTVVKEAYEPRRVAEPTSYGTGVALPRQGSLPRAAHPFAPEDSYRPTTDGDGHAVGAGAPGGLYVLRYVGPRRGTDRGWIYGTIDPNGTVTSSGVVEQCVGCHRSAPHHRLFGLHADP